MDPVGRVVDRYSPGYLGGECQGRCRHACSCMHAYALLHDSLVTKPATPAVQASQLDALHRATVTRCHVLTIVQSIIRETFANVTRVVNGFFSWVVVALPNRKQLPR